ncbi:hypothetical protein [Mesorhizobium sp.]|uniref:hypothetical protein n=1 Tax=Mesorhizobium sp. TaxID=1871066 RepID=UPI000FE42EA3|nr:hypothetical protein [Mesorhizobium sp.]RWN55767.1 MAG: hypothetical protein EOS00_26340 [Mesorhizobium sp.]RWN58863.1 MAG: hypothetical protein EOR98_00160 [Mesorhizobium sp.]RWN74818.1 MAG: hypothetical protein EOS01_23955 [Mesorhizobium sp.]RWN80372.1 MAG: hypothetical protein EOS02_00160 [Mesorhizobium sp.]RWN84125.1 MAG: hypothetical protein EOS04_26620 [Mesorhizobium sp.]
MAQDLSIAEKYLVHIQPSAPIDLMSASMLYAEDGALRISYAPFDHIASKAKLVVVGITPGMTQAVAALAAARENLRRGVPLVHALRHAKLTASFSGGVMRKNLVTMLDAIGVANLFGIESTDALFTADAEHVHFTSALRYPVFVDGKNYNGTPDMLRTPLLRRMIETHLAEEARVLPEAVWLPLGPKAEAAVAHLARIGLLDRRRIIAGMPHPSGANAERVAVFLGRKDPSLASDQTNPGPLLHAYNALCTQIAELKGVAA